MDPLFTLVLIFHLATGAILEKTVAHNLPAEACISASIYAVKKYPHLEAECRPESGQQI